jgi:hypothetical protein
MRSIVSTHPVSLTFTPPEGPRRRLTILLRAFMVIPHALLVGVSVLVLLGAPGREEVCQNESVTQTHSTTEQSVSPDGRQETVETVVKKSHGKGFSWHLDSTAAGALGVAASTVALLDWFAVLFFGSVLVGAQGLKVTYLRWRARVLVYASLLHDQYPPFGEADYPASLVIADASPQRRRLSVLLRPLAVIPHLLVLLVLTPFYLLALVACWVMLLIDGRSPPSLSRFILGVLQWTLRVEAYLLLMHDEYPPFSFT